MGAGEQRVAPRPFDLQPRSVVVGKQSVATGRDRGLGRRAGRAETTGHVRRHRLVDPPSELVDVEPVGFECVTRVAMRNSSGAEHATQSGHQHSQLIDRTGGRIGGPERVDQRLRRDRPAAVDRQTLQQQAHLSAPERRLVDAFHRQPAEQPHPQFGWRLSHRQILPRSCTSGCPIRPAQAVRTVIPLKHGTGLRRPIGICADRRRHR